MSSLGLPAAAMSRPQVWVVDDSPAEVDIVGRSLAETCRVRTFLDGAELIEALSHQPPPDVLVLDWQLPGLSGIEVCRYLRGASASATLPILLLTAHQRPEDVAEGLSAGANDYVFKPFRPLELAARVHALARWDALRRQALATEQARRVRAEGSLSEAQAAEARAWHEARKHMAEEHARLLDLANDAIIIRDLDDRITFWSHGAERLYGWTQQEALGRAPHTLLQTHFPHSLLEAQEALAEHGRWEGELVHTTKAGERVVVASRWAQQRSGTGHLLAVLESNTDITRRKHAEERTARLQSAISVLSGALLPEDVARVVLSEAMEGLDARGGIVYQLHPDGTLRSLADVGYKERFIHPHRVISPDAPEPAAAVLRTREPLWLESLEVLRAHFPHLADAQPLYGNQCWAAVPLLVHGRAVGSFLLSFGRPCALAPEDRTLLLALAQKCAQALERTRLLHEMRAAVRLRDDFLSVASHELKTPLTPLHLRLQSLRREAQDATLPPEKLRERVSRAVEGAEAQVRKLGDLVNDLLDVARISAGKLQLERVPVDLAELVREVAARFTPQAQKAGCALELDVPATLVGLWNTQRLEQVVINLLTNALKYGVGKPVHLRLVSEGTRAHLTVRDEGIGIAVDDQARIFERFERAVSDRHFGGLGLGLYICRQIVDALGGTISVRSEPGQGATFEVRLPLDSAG